MCEWLCGVRQSPAKIRLGDPHCRNPPYRTRLEEKGEEEENGFQTRLDRKCDWGDGQNGEWGLTLNEYERRIDCTAGCYVS